MVLWFKLFSAYAATVSVCHREESRASCSVKEKAAKKLTLRPGPRLHPKPCLNLIINRQLSFRLDCNCDTVANWIIIGRAGIFLAPDLQ